MRNETPRDLYRDLYADLFEFYNDFDIPECTHNRVHKCQAWFYETNDYILLRSYRTLVAIYDKVNNVLVSRGRFSSTTYQHIRKFRNDYLPDMHNTPEINLELVNWYK